MLNNFHNPDILTCLANLSSDEVFTPPKVVNDMLDVLPKEIWSDDNITFLDPGSKSGVFLREITKRLLIGLENKFSNIEKRLNHILHNQVFGIGITRLTTEISRRTLYLSKKANKDLSIVKFDNEEGNLRFLETNHLWEDGNKCKYCGVAKELYDRGEDFESYSYSFIHDINLEEIFKMKFDIIVGNPPYQMMDGGHGASASPIYDKFVNAAIRMNPRYITMIIPSRWFAGGKGLNDFRDSMLSDKRIKYIKDYINAKECFPGVSLGGGVNYFLWDRDYEGPCEVVNSINGKENSLTRNLDDYKIFIRNNIGIGIINKILNKSFKSIETLISTRNPFGFDTKSRGMKTPEYNSDVILHSSGGKGYVSKYSVKKGKEFTNKFKIMMSARTSEHAGEPDSKGTFRVLSSTQILPPGNICTDSYLMVGPFENEIETSDFLSYMHTKFFRYLLLQVVTSIALSAEKFCFIPVQKNYLISDEELYKKYDLNQDEINDIEQVIKEY